MSLLLKLIADGMRTHDGVVEAAKLELERELAMVATGPFSLKLYALRKSEWGNLAFGTGSVPVDRALYGIVPTALGDLHVALPFSAKDTLGGQYLLDVPVGTPLHVQLERGALGGWTSSWQPRGASQALTREAFREHALRKGLEAARTGAGLEWNSDLAGRYTAKHRWTLALAPRGRGCTRLLIQTGTTRLLMARSFGVKAVITNLKSAHHVLTSKPVSALGALDEVAPSESMVEHVTELVASGLAPVETTPRAAPTSRGGQHVFTPEEKEQREVSHRALLSLILSVCSLPLMFCLPLSAFSGWLGWSARRRALDAKLKVPFLAHAGMALSAFSMLLSVVVGLSLPGQWKAEQRGASRAAKRGAAIRAVDASRARALREDPAADASDEPVSDDDAAARLTQLIERRRSVASPTRASSPRVVATSGVSRQSPPRPTARRTVEP